MSVVCAKCSKPLEVEIERYDDEDDSEDVGMTDDTPQTVPDDVALSCGDHFHWECLLEAYEVSKCPTCSRNITTNPAGSSSSSAANSNMKILVDMNNEGGLQHQIDIFPLLQEESYLRAYPEDRKCRAFLEFCREGDFHAIADLLKSCDEDADEDEEDMVPEAMGPSKSVEEILRYQVRANSSCVTSVRYHSNISIRTQSETCSQDYTLLLLADTAKWRGYCCC
jgi:DNA-directed RNA polymerase subunit RPC12/RpoP